MHLSNADVDQWHRYRDGFDPVAVTAQLGYSAELARRDGEWLLLRAHSLDPVGNAWNRLMRRAPSTAWKELKDTALSVLDYRIAAEIFLLFYKDLAARGQAEPLPDIPHNGAGRRATESISGWVITSASTASGLGSAAARRRVSCQRSVSMGCHPASSHWPVMPLGRRWAA